MDVKIWFTLGGALLVLMALAGTMLARWPVSASMLYLAVGLAASPWGFAWSRVDLLSHVGALELLAEVVVLLSLFTSGLKLSAGLSERRWLVPLRLAVLSMAATVGAVASLGVLAFGLPLGAAVLLGGILAPTDPVLASDVQLADATDRDQLRFALTGEGGLNDGTAFPVVMLGLGLLGAHDIGAFGWRWLLVDGVWSVFGGIAIGAVFGTAVAQIVLYLRRAHKEALGYDNFLALGLIALTYGVALQAHTYGFLAVFAAGVALRRVEQSDRPAATRVPIRPAPAQSSAVLETIEQAQADPDTGRAEVLATDPEHAPAYMAHAVLSFNEQLERIGEVAVVVVIGMLLWSVAWHQASWWFVGAMLLVVRPLSVALGLAGARTGATQRRLIGWFGIRGVGSLYYLAYAINHGMPAEHIDIIVAFTLSVVLASIVVHGVSVTPLMAQYGKRRGAPR